MGTYNHQGSTSTFTAYHKSRFTYFVVASTMHATLTVSNAAVATGCFVYADTQNNIIKTSYQDISGSNWTFTIPLVPWYTTPYFIYYI